MSLRGFCARYALFVLGLILIAFSAVFFLHIDVDARLFPVFYLIDGAMLAIAYLPIDRK